MVVRPERARRGMRYIVPTNAPTCAPESSDPKLAGLAQGRLRSGPIFAARFTCRSYRLPNSRSISASFSST